MKTIKDLMQNDLKVTIEDLQTSAREDLIMYEEKLKACNNGLEKEWIGTLIAYIRYKFNIGDY